MQTLHLEIGSPGDTGGFQNVGEAVRIVRGKRRAQRIAVLQHASCASEPTDIGCDLTREHRIVRMAALLASLISVSQ